MIDGERHTSDQSETGHIDAKGVLFFVVVLTGVNPSGPSHYKGIFQVHNLHPTLKESFRAQVHIQHVKFVL
jgi:hypothetical protein